MSDKRYICCFSGGKDSTAMLIHLYFDKEFLDATLSKATEWLNKLSDENEQLKCGNKNLKAILNDFINICNRLQSNPNDKQTLGVARDMLQNMGVELE